MALFRHKVTGELVSRPAHYADHKVLGKNLELISSEETEIEAAAPAKKRSTKKTAEYIPAAIDADGDGLVQDGTEWEREVGVEIPQEENIETNEENN
jgi:hypothetical protein